MNRPNFSEIASGGAHIQTHRREDGKWEAITGLPDVEPAVAASEKDAIAAANAVVFKALNLGGEPRA